MAKLERKEATEPKQCIHLQDFFCQSQALSPSKTKRTINIPQTNENFNVIFLKTTNESTNLEDIND